MLNAIDVSGTAALSGNFEAQLKAAAQQQAQLSRSIGQAPSPSLQEPGISSAVNELLAEIVETRNLADNFRSTLGLNTSQNGAQGAAPAPAPSRFVDVLRDARSSLLRANEDLATCLVHINS